MLTVKCINWEKKGRVPFVRFQSMTSASISRVDVQPCIDFNEVNEDH